MCDKDHRRQGALRLSLLGLFAVVVLLLLIPAIANASSAPGISSADSYTFIAGIPDTFTIRTEGFSEAPSITCEGDLPSGLLFSDRPDRTAIIEGSPDAGTGGVYSITITARTANDEYATQEFALTVYEEAPTILSGESAVFTVGDIYTGFTITTTGYPRPTITCDSLPGGLWIMDWSNGSADIYGPAAPGTGGVYHTTITASNGVDPAATQELTLTVNEAPVITSPGNATFAMDCSNGFTITTTGYPTPTIGYTGTLPGGLYFDASYGDGTASISGTPDPGTAAGDYPITITASNDVDPDATQAFTLTVYEESPTFTQSAYDATFTVGAGDGWFFAYANGYPFPQITCEDPLPGGLSFTNNGNGSAQIMGTPTAGTGGFYPITITAGNRVGTDTREIALTVNEAPAITSVDNATLTEGIPDEFTFMATGYPKPAITSVGGLPSGVSLEDNGDGTATLSGTPAAGASWYVYHITIRATNGVDPAATQDFTLSVDPLPTIASDDHCTFTVGTEGTFDVTYFYASGTVCSGDLPSGVTFNGFLGDTYGSFFGTPDPGTGGVYNVTLTTSGPYRPATQAFTLTVNEAPAIITQPTGQTVNAGQAASFSASASGYPLPTVQWQQRSTAVGAEWQDVPGATSTTYDLTAQSSLNGYQYRATFSNAVGDPAYSDAALLTVLSGVTAPVITQQPTGQTVLFGQRATFTAAADGNPVPTVRWQLSTDGGRHWSDIRGATSLSYTTAATTLGMCGYRFRAVFRNSAGSVTSDAARLSVNPIPFKVLVGTLKWTGPSHGKYQATVSLSITDPSGNLIAANNVKITGVWKSAGGRVLGTSSGTTDSHGVLQLSVHELSAQPATFVVTSATKTGYSWQK